MAAAIRTEACLHAKINVFVLLIVCDVHVYVTRIEISSVYVFDVVEFASLRVGVFQSGMAAGLLVVVGGLQFVFEAFGRCRNIGLGALCANGDGLAPVFDGEAVAFEQYVEKVGQCECHSAVCHGYDVVQIGNLILTYSH